MPRIPKFNLGKAIPKSTTFPDPMWMRTERRLGTNGWEQLGPDERITIRTGWPVTHHHVTSYGQPSYSIAENWVPVQGPDLPLNLERRRQFIRNAQEAYERELAEERARQAYNRKAAAWNEYQNLPEIERRFWANKNQIRNDLMAEFQDSPYEIEDYMTSYRGPYDFIKLNSPEERFNYFDYPTLKSFDDFPEDLADMPWNR